MNSVRRIKLKQPTTVTESARGAKKKNLLVENKREKCPIACEMGKSGWSHQATSLGTNPPFSSRLRGFKQIRKGMCASVSQNTQDLKVLDILALEPFQKISIELALNFGLQLFCAGTGFICYLSRGIALCPRLQTSRRRHI